MQTVSTVEHLLKNRQGEIGGLVLGDGTIIDTPPEHGDELKSLLTRGTEVRIEGEARHTRRGLLRVRARRIVLPKSRRFPRNDTAYEAVGRIRRFFYNGSGRVNGIRLSDGSLVKTPPRQSEQLLAHLKYGDKIRVVGRESASNSGKLVAYSIQILKHYRGEAPARAAVFQPGSLPAIVHRANRLLQKQEKILLELQAIQSVLARHHRAADN